jgi:DNA-binding MarR family transcriptional regulator
MSKTAIRQFPPLTTSRKQLLVKGRDDNFRALVRDLVDFSVQLQEIRGAIARRMGVTPPQYNILMMLSQASGEGITIRELSERLRVSVPFVVTETGRLEQAGLLEKKADQRDRRRVNLELTDEARTALFDIAPVQQRVNNVLFGSLDAKDFTELARLTRGLLSSCAGGLREANHPEATVTRIRSRARPERA